MNALKVEFGFRCSSMMNAAFWLFTFANTTKPKVTKITACWCKPKVLTRPRLLARVTLALRSLKREFVSSALSMRTRMNDPCDGELLGY
jgi:hypothetical protein